MNSHINTYTNIKELLDEFVSNSIIDNRVDYVQNLVSPIIYNDLNDSIFVFLTKKDIVSTSIIYDFIYNSYNNFYEYTEEDDIYNIYASRGNINVKTKENYTGYIKHIMVDNVKVVCTEEGTGTNHYSNFNINFHNWNDNDIHCIQIQLNLETEELEEDEEPYTYLDSYRSIGSYERILTRLPLNSIVILPKTLSYLPSAVWNASIKGLLTNDYYNNYINEFNDYFTDVLEFSDYLTANKARYIEVLGDNDDTTLWYNSIQYIKPYLQTQQAKPQVYITSDFLPAFGNKNNFTSTNLHLLNEILYTEAYNDENYKPLIEINITKDFLLSVYPYIKQIVYDAVGVQMVNTGTARVGNNTYLTDNFAHFIVTDKAKNPTYNNNWIDSWSLLEQNENNYMFAINPVDTFMYSDGASTREIYHLLKSKKIPQYLFYRTSDTYENVGNQSREYILSEKIDSSFTIYGSAFNSDKILSVTLMSENPPQLAYEAGVMSNHYTAFESSQSYPIYVPDDAVNTYKAEANYAPYINRIKPLSQKV